MKSIHFLLIALTIGFFATSCEKSSSENSSEHSEANHTPETKAPEAKAYTIDAENAEVMWMGSKEAGFHYGSFDLSNGNLKVSDAGVEGGEAVINIASITPMDELPEEMKEKLKGHLTSEDFFNTAQYPDAKIVIKGSSAYNGGGETAPADLPEALSGYFVATPTHTIDAELTVKGEAHPISFPAMVQKNDDGTVTAMALVTFDRRDYGLRFMSDTESTVNPDIHVGLKVNAKG